MEKHFWQPCTIFLLKNNFINLLESLVQAKHSFPSMNVDGLGR